MGQRVVVFHPDAAEEAEAARDWYSERSLVAARAFVSELIHAVEQVAKAPERWPSYEHGTRRYVFTTFPFVLIYRVRKERIEVVAVAHAKRKPVYWKGR